MDDLPPLVARAVDLARRQGFPLTREEAGPDRPSACLPGAGRFLAVLAAGCVGGRIAELGTGVGIGTSWMAGTMPPDCVLFTVEIDEQRAAWARELLAGEPRAEVITGDGITAIAHRGPFDLIFADSGVRDARGFAALVGLLRVGGRIVMDDVTPRRALPPDSRLRADDPKRRYFASEPRLTATEVVLPDLENSLLVGTRTG